MKRCPVCSVRIAREALMCGEHWRMVPPRMQVAVIAAHENESRPGFDAFEVSVRVRARCVAYVRQVVKGAKSEDDT